ncbi:hypothetical protein HID58_084505 [Brassica napus]|uniref:DEAD/DEAH-box helicase domain-containing protein n=1 Tax=Brassica napus TaxID=3708 RepID=A0ABQ7XLG0_BRANA|nr:hypothetical protein HID58_084505 [Brassica napus]
MASTVGVPSLYQVPHLETSKPTSMKRSTSISLSLDNPFFSSPLSLRRTRLIHSSLLPPSAVATPNSVLSEEAFKSLGLSDDFDLKEGSSSEDDAEELAISKLGLPQRLGESLEKRGITHLFPIQRAVLVPALDGRDIIARAKTGTGKTLAFGIPIIKRLTEQAGDYSEFRSLFNIPFVYFVISRGSDSLVSG